jgi:integrase
MAGSGDVPGAMVRFALLTATRRGEAARMTWSELHKDHWIIPAARMKAKLEHVVPLSPAAQAVLDSLPRVGPWVFTLGRPRPLTNFVGYKSQFDQACGVTGWRFHDLRRTARSLMSAADVDPDIAERCLAHTIGGIRGVYDRYAYFKQKKAAFEALAGIVERIVDPIDNVIELKQSR